MAKGHKLQNTKPTKGDKQPDSLLVELVELLGSIDTNGKQSKLNETTISDNNGSRIYL